VNAPVIPDYISPIVAYRVWHWDATGLTSFNGERWLPGKALTAKCAKCLTTDHEPPADGCSCGVYAAKNYHHLQGIIDSNVEYAVHGEVYLWGKVVEHELGWRAQFAYPKSLVLSSNIKPRLESLKVYGADISIAAHLLWTKGSGYTPDGCDWLRGHPLALQPGDCVTMLGRGIGLVERDDGASGCISGSVVCVRLRTNLYIVPHQDIVWDCQNSRWKVDLSRYRGAVLLPSSKGWKINCAILELKNTTSDVGRRPQEPSPTVLTAESFADLQTTCPHLVIDKFGHCEHCGDFSW
jgi:hypothetical protein